jgi:hypothetical protein
MIMGPCGTLLKRIRGFSMSRGFKKGRAYMKEIRVLIQSSSYNKFSLMHDV